MYQLGLIFCFQWFGTYLLDPDSGSSQTFDRIRIQENNTDPADPDPQHWFREQHCGVSSNFGSGCA